MTNILQGNLNRSRTAHNLLTQICSEKNADMVIISEQYRSRDASGWYSDELNTAAIWIPNPQQIHISDHGAGNGFVWVRHKDIYYVSVYLTPNERIEEFKTKLNSLEDAAQEMQGGLVIGGDFNAKAIEWG